MADVITRFKLETTQYDSKIRDAAKSLGEFARQASQAGKDFDRFASAGVESARAFGNISTNATNAKDKVKELVAAYNSAAKAYNAMTEEQKRGDFGKAWAESMKTLKGRIADAKAEMNSTPGVLDQLTSKFTINVDALKLFNLGLKGAQAALKVAKDAFFANEQNLDEWGRTVKSAESLYSGFINSLNSGDISGYLMNMDSIVSAAREAYNAMDELGTYNAFNSGHISAARTNMMTAIVDYREGSATKGQVEESARIYKDLLRGRQLREENLYQKEMASLARDRGIDPEMMRRIMEGKYGTFEELKQMRVPSKPSTSFVTPTGLDIQLDFEIAITEEQKLSRALNMLNDHEINRLQALKEQAENTGHQITQIDRQVQRYANGQIKPIGGGGGKGSGGAADVEQKGPYNVDDFGSLVLPSAVYGNTLADMQKITSANVKTEPLDIFGPLQSMEEYAKRYREEMEAIGQKSPEVYAQMAAQLEAINAEMDRMKGVDHFADIGLNAAKAWNACASSISQVGSALAVLDNPAAQVLGTISQAIANIALGYSRAVAEAAEIGPFAWLGFAATGAATMISSISAIKSATAGSYAEGGIVPGNNHNDGVFVAASSGELILNMAQQNTIAGQLQRGTGNAGGSQPYVSGEYIYLGLNNYLRRSGRGEIVTSR